MNVVEAQTREAVIRNGRDGRNQDRTAAGAGVFPVAVVEIQVGEFGGEISHMVDRLKPKTARYYLSKSTVAGIQYLLFPLGCILAFVFIEQWAAENWLLSKASISMWVSLGLLAVTAQFLKILPEKSENIEADQLVISFKSKTIRISYLTLMLIEALIAGYLIISAFYILFDQSHGG